jgi:crotonobetainyl-CoA:carnitine CoA-transferase CaiB-like acyl-CoA transferase
MLQQISQSDLIAPEVSQPSSIRVTSSTPLHGYVVVEIGHSVAAPYAGLVFAQLGAEVIKVEHPEGGDHSRGWGLAVADNASALFHSMNRDKLGVAIDLRDERAREELMLLIVSRADVVIQNLRPNSVEALGLGASELLRRKPQLIYCNISAFGRTGPLAAKPGYDPLMQAYGGLMSVTGEEGRPPVRVGVSIIDIGTGMWAVIGSLAALLARAPSGSGAVVDTSLYETALAWMSAHIAEFSAGGAEPRRHGSGAPQIAPYEMFRTTDGELMVAAGNDALFGKLCAVLGHPEWSQDGRFRTNPLRVQHRQLLAALLQERFSTHGTDRWRRELDAGGIPNAPLRSTAAVMSDPQTGALDILQRVPRAPVAGVGIPVQFNGERAKVRLPAPRLGEHTREIFGYPTHV